MTSSESQRYAEHCIGELAGQPEPLSSVENIQMLGSILTYSRDGICVFDAEGNIMEWNPAMEQMFKIPREEALSLHIIDLHARLSLDPSRTPEIMHRVRSAYSRLQTDVKQLPSDDPEVWEFRSCPEQARFHQMVLFPIPSERGMMTGAVLRDITQLKRMDQELLKLNKLEAVGTLAGGIAHQFNNLLTAILGNIALAQMDAAQNASGERTPLDEAEAACLKARCLTQQLLSFSRGGTPVRKPTSMMDALQQTIRSLHGEHVICHTEFATDLWPAQVDIHQFQQALQNIILNAHQAMGENELVLVSAHNERLQCTSGLMLPSGPYVHIRIRDRGQGIAPENLERIFDPFFTTKNSGAGLGLTAAYAIIKAHQGRIDVESQPSKGSTFHIYIPALAPADVTPTEERTVMIAAAPRSVLIMDDEPFVRHVIERMLVRLGYLVETAAEGGVAIALYRQRLDAGNPFDAVIMDLTIADGMSGKEAMERLRQIDPKVRAVVSSGYATDPIMTNFQDYGFSGVVAKPFQMEDLRDVLEQITTAPRV